MFQQPHGPIYFYPANSPPNNQPVQVSTAKELKALLKLMKANEPPKKEEKKEEKKDDKKPELTPLQLSILMMVFAPFIGMAYMGGFILLMKAAAGTFGVR